jgi:hypothetical protein
MDAGYQAIDAINLLAAQVPPYVDILRSPAPWNGMTVRGWQTASVQ